MHPSLEEITVPQVVVSMLAVPRALFSGDMERAGLVGYG
jgi:hypothetical protein